MDKLENFLNTKKMKSKFGNWETGISISNYMSGVYIQTCSNCGYNIRLSHNREELHSMIISVGENIMKFECKSVEEIIKILQSVKI